MRRGIRFHVLTQLYLFSLSLSFSAAAYYGCNPTCTEEKTVGQLLKYCNSISALRRGNASAPHIKQCIATCAQVAKNTALHSGTIKSLCFFSSDLENCTKFDSNGKCKSTK
jgi:hypothetical protein